MYFKRFLPLLKNLREWGVIYKVVGCIPTLRVWLADNCIINYNFSLFRGKVVSSSFITSYLTRSLSDLINAKVV